MNYCVQMYRENQKQWVNTIEDVCAGDIEHIKETLKCRPFYYRIVNTIQNKVEWRNYVKR